MFSIIMDERKRREIDPTLQMLRSCANELEEGGAEKYTRKRVEEMLEFFESMTSLYGEFRRLPLNAVRRLGKLKGKLRGLFGSQRVKEQ